MAIAVVGLHSVPVRRLNTTWEVSDMDKICKSSVHFEFTIYIVYVNEASIPCNIKHYNISQ